jgi:hypothetical protein
MGWTNFARAKRRISAIAALPLERVRVQLRENAQDLVPAIAGNAPRDHGDLAESVRWEDHTATERPKVKVRAGGDKTTKPVRAGASATYDYALADEFGTQDMAARPFFFPTYRGRRRRYKAALRAAGKAGVAEAIRKP